MRVSISALIAVVFLLNTAFAQNAGSFKLKENKYSLKGTTGGLNLSSDNLNSKTGKNFQLKTRKTVTSYFGAGYSFMIFTNKYMSDAFPVLDTRNGSFLTNINLFFGFAIGLIGCFKGYFSRKGTEGVGKSANSAVVVASLLIFIIDLIAVQITEFLGLI